MGNSAIWQVQSGAANGTEATAGDANTVDLDVNLTPTTATGHIFVSEFNVRNAVAENPQVSGNGNEVQDMGLDGIDVTLTGMIKDVDATNSDVSKVMTWTKEDKTTTGYTKGRFGLRIDDFPYFNMVPTSTYGYVLNSVRWIRDPEKDNKIGFILVLRVGGNVTGWLTAGGF